MKKEGWQFASHSWGHINMTTASVDDIKKDTALWQKEVQPIVGKTPVLIFPFGADIGSFTNYTNDNAKYTYLKSSGFSIFDNVDASQTSWGQLTNDYYRNARINVDGIRLHETMTGENTVLNDFFNTKDFIIVINNEERETKVVNKKNWVIFQTVRQHYHSSST